MTLRSTSPRPTPTPRSNDWTSILAPILSFLSIMAGLQFQLSPLSARLDRIDNRLEKIESVGYRLDSYERAIDEFRKRNYQQ